MLGGDAGSGTRRTGTSINSICPRRRWRRPTGSKDDRVLGPCAYVGGNSLYLDPDRAQLLCSVDGSAEDTFAVRDVRGEPVGTIRRVPSGRPLLRPTWRIEQSGGDKVMKERVLEWRAGAEIVMLSEGIKSVTIKSSWLDRRLAFAHMLVGR